MRWSLFFILLFGGCATAPVGAPASPASPALYREGLRLLDSGDPAGALQAFDRFDVTTSASPWSQLAVYDSGRALEALTRWTEAADRYRSVVRATASGRGRALQAIALYRLSFCAEALGDDAAMVAALHDAEARRADLPKEISEAEFPARMAAAYARVGNMPVAAQYYAQAERGIARLRQAAHSAPQALPAWVPQTLYEMGRASLLKPTLETFEASLRPLRLGQAYLLQAAETGASPWAERAVDDLTGAYGDLLSVLSRASAAGGASDGTSDEGILLARRAAQPRVWGLASETLVAVDELRARRLPPDRSSSHEAERLFHYLDGAASDLRAVLAQHPAGEGPTDDSRERAARRLKPKGP